MDVVEAVTHQFSEHDREAYFLGNIVLQTSTADNQARQHLNVFGFVDVEQNSVALKIKLKVIISNFWM